MLNGSLLLSLLGGLAGILCERWLLSALIKLAPPNLPRIEDVQLSGRVLLFTAALTLLTGLMFGLLPAWSATGTKPALAFNQRSLTSGPLRRRLFDGLLVAEIESAGFTISLPIEGSQWGSIFVVGDQPVPPPSIPSALNTSRQ
jgi:hypothetical protein